MHRLLHCTRLPLPGLLAVLLAACGGGDPHAPAAPPTAPWQDARRLQAFGPARSVSLGFDGVSSHVVQDGFRHVPAQGFAADLAYIGDTGAAPHPQARQWLRLALRGDRYFETQGQHLPIALRFAQYPDPRTSASEPLGAEGLMIFLGRDTEGHWDCPSRSSINVYFETRVSGRTETPDVRAIKCAHDAPGLQDGTWYRIDISAGAEDIRYAITTLSGQVLAQGQTDALNYPELPYNSDFLDHAGAARSRFDFAARYAGIREHTEFALLAAFTTPGPAWSLEFRDIESGWE